MACTRPSDGAVGAPSERKLVYKEGRAEAQGEADRKLCRPRHSRYLVA